MSKWDDMDMTGWVSGLTAIDEDTYRKKVVDEEAAAQGDKPALAAKEDLGLLERRLETKLDSIKNVESKIDKLLGLIYDNEEMLDISQFPKNTFGFVYRINHLPTDKSYIGKKVLFW